MSEIDFRGVWFSWEDHRRSRELSREFNVKYLPITCDMARVFRYPYLSILTIYYLLRNKPSLVFCQNPSIVLSFLLVMLKSIFGYRLVVDRHSNFKFEYKNSSNIKWKIFNWLSAFTIKRADFTIVTNDYLKSFCESLGGRGLVLEDKLPCMDLVDESVCPESLAMKEKYFDVMVVSTFDSDEPIGEIVDAAKRLPSHIRVFFTGKYGQTFSEDERLELKEFGIFLLGFVDECSYQNLMYHSDLVLVLTKKEYILNCGAYEALSLLKPMVLSNTETIKNYFSSGCLYTTPDSNEIFEKVLLAEGSIDDLCKDIEKFRSGVELEWAKKFGKVHREIFQL